VSDGREMYGTAQMSTPRKKTRSHPEMVGDMSRVTARPVYK